MVKLRFFFFLFLISIPGVVLFYLLSAMYPSEINLTLRMLGRVAMIYLTLTLLVSPIAAYISDKTFRDRFIKLRKLLGLAGFYFFIVHAYQYVVMEYGYHSGEGFIGTLFSNILARPDALSGFVAGFVMLILGVISNNFSMQLLGGKLWKTIQTLAYPLFLLVLIHIALASRLDLFYASLVVILVLVRSISYFSHSRTLEKEAIPGKTLYVCVPCGYIYDQDVGDPDSGIPPGTRFEDIPDTWRCPVCGVTKADFEVLGIPSSLSQTFIAHNMATVSSVRKLTDDVVEIILTPDAPIVSEPGQFITLGFHDELGEFHRSYSIVENRDNTITLAIRLKPDGRGSKQLITANLAGKIKIAGPFGRFTLHNTGGLRVFIATGTGLSPIIAFLESIPEAKKILHIGAQTEKNLFYMDRLAAIPNLEVCVYLSREQNPKYQSGRLNVAEFTYPLDTEFYICGNPSLIHESERILREKGYTNVFHESFTT